MSTQNNKNIIDDTALQNEDGEDIARFGYFFPDNQNVKSTKIIKKKRKINSLKVKQNEPNEHFENTENIQANLELSNCSISDKQILNTCPCVSKIMNESSEIVDNDSRGKISAGEEEIITFKKKNVQQAEEIILKEKENVKVLSVNKEVMMTPRISETTTPSEQGVREIEINLFHRDYVTNSMSMTTSLEEECNLIKHEELLDLSDMKELNEEFLPKIQENKKVANHYSSFRYTLIILYSLIIQIGVIFLLHLLSLNYIKNVIFNVYIMLGYFFLLSSFYLSFKGLSALRLHKYLKLSENNLLFAFNILLNIFIILVSSVPSLIGEQLYMYLHFNTKYMSYLLVSLIILGLGLIFNYSMSAFYQEYFSMYPMKERLLNNKKNKANV